MGPLRPEILKRVADDVLRHTAKYGHAGPFVYFVQSVDGGLVKIGSTHDLPTRLAALQIGSPVALTVRLVIPGDARLERQIHAALAPLREHGEWFGPPEEVRTYALGLAERYKDIDPVEFAEQRVAAAKREVLLIIERYRAGIAIREIADELGCSVGRVHVKLQQLRKRGVHLPLRRLEYTRPDPSWMTSANTSGRKTLLRSEGSTVPPGVDEDAPLW